MKTTYIVIQMQVDKKEPIKNGENISMSNVVRRVEAESVEEAIGKFVLETKNIVAQQKLNIDCYPLLTLKSID